MIKVESILKKVYPFPIYIYDVMGLNFSAVLSVLAPQASFTSSNDITKICYTICIIDCGVYRGMPVFTRSALLDDHMV